MCDDVPPLATSATQLPKRQKLGLAESNTAASGLSELILVVFRRFVMMAAGSVNLRAGKHNHGDVRGGAFAAGESEDQVRRTAHGRRAGNSGEDAEQREIR